jgi:phospholipid/cholesterol/gamma-HCH transport system permease protein
MFLVTAHLGKRVIDYIEGFGRFTYFCGSTWRWMFRDVRNWARPSHILPLFYQIGARSVGVVLVVGTFIGMVMAIEAYSQFQAIGQEARMGGVIGVTVLKQIGPVLAAVMIAGRVGGSVSAELGTMRVTEQLDAMRVMGTDPIAHLVVPRVVTCIIMLPVLTLLSDLMGVMGGYFISVHGYEINATSYWEFSARFVSEFDIATGLIKSIFFGLAIGLIGCYKGFYCKSGAAGVGKAATESFVTSFLAIIVMNFFLAGFLSSVYYIIYGHSSLSAFRG